jgi:hypothetical protein
VSGKLRAQRAKAMKFKDGYMVSSGDPTRVYIDGAVRHVMLRQGVLGIKVRTAGGWHGLGGGSLAKPGWDVRWTLAKPEQSGTMSFAFLRVFWFQARGLVSGAGLFCQGCMGRCEFGTVGVGCLHKACWDLRGARVQLLLHMMPTTVDSSCDSSCRLARHCQRAVCTGPTQSVL